MTEFFDWVLYDNGNIRGHRNNDIFRKRRGFCEKIEVTKSKIQLNWFLHVYGDLILIVITATDEDIPITDSTSDTEANSFFST